MNKKRALTGALLFFSTSLIVLTFYYVFYNPAKSAKEKHVISIEEVSQLQDERPVYFIDLREPEFFEAHLRIKGAVNIRRADISGFEDIHHNLGLNDREAEEALFVLYCFHGNTARGKTAAVNRPNVKFLAGGIEELRRKEKKNGGLSYLLPRTIISFETVIDEKIRKHNFNIGIPEAVALVREENAQLIDARWEPEIVFPSAYSFRVDWWPEEEYNKKLQKILQWEKDKIVVVAEEDDTVIWSLLLMHRLVGEHDFNRGQFYLLKGKSREFYLALQEEGLLNE